MTKQVRHLTLARALKGAKVLAREGPRVAAVARVSNGYVALPGFMDENNEHFTQIVLVTPDGRVWECFDPVSLTIAERDALG